MSELCKGLSEAIKEHEKEYAFMTDVEFPLEISGVIFHKMTPGLELAKEGDLVGVRPCGGDNPDNRTYVGIYLGDLPIKYIWEIHKETKKLHVHPTGNPGMFVPEMGRIVYGCESWWCKIKTPEQLKEITDKDIENVPYVKVLKAMLEKECKDGDESS